MKSKSAMNLHFNDFPNVLVGMLSKCNEEPEKRGKPMNEAELRLSYEGMAKFYLFQDTEYKRLQLLELNFSSSNVEKTQQSIIYRYNYQSAKLSMLENSIKSIYELLGDKNEPLLQYIQKNIGTNCWFMIHIL